MTAIKCQQKQKASRAHSQIIEERLSSIQEEGIIKLPLLFAVTTVTFCQAGSRSLTQHYKTVSHC